MSLRLQAVHPQCLYDPVFTSMSRKMEGLITGSGQEVSAPKIFLRIVTDFYRVHVAK